MNRVLTDVEYRATTATLVALAGLVFDDSRRAALSAIVHDRVDSTGHDTVVGYLDWIATPSGAAERQALLDAVTIQETHFYRNLPQIDALRGSVLPELLSRARATGRPLTVWSAGCSTGEEPYTLAMVLLELMAGRTPVPVRIVASDVSASALAVARQGVYSGRTIQLAEPGAVARWFDPQADGGYSVRDEARALVEFRLHNLVTDEPPFDPGQVDLVVCRNVTIYFARETTQALVHRFHRSLTHGGYLLLGHAETLWQVSDAFSLVPVGEAFVYRKDAHPVRRGATLASPTASRPSGSAPASAGAPHWRGVREVLRAPVRLSRRPVASAPQATPVPTPHEDLASARDALSTGRYQEAASLAERATAAHPLLVEAYVVQGRALSNLGDDDGAIAALRKAVFLEPDAGHAHFVLATTLARVGDVEGASLSFAAAADSLPRATPERVGELLDGRAVSDLVDLCRQLAASTRAVAEADRATAESAGRRVP
jgi:chemotaxis protein methyltransferase CheR